MAPRISLVNRLLLLLVAVVTICGLVYWQKRNAEYIRWVTRINEVPPPGKVENAIVVAKTREEDVRWLHTLRPEWIPYIYTASSPPEPGYNLVPLGNRGREAMAYLSFIITNYDSLPNVTAFVHAGIMQRHNDLLGPYTYKILNDLRLDNVHRRGYVNLRCVHDPGCPIGVNPLDPSPIDRRKHDIRASFADVYMELFDVPRSKVPSHVGHVCCGQFAVSRQRILQRPKEDYERMVKWALEGTETDSFGVGWVFEKVWHIIFGMNATYCPDERVCRCELLGWCGAGGEGSGYSTSRRSSPVGLPTDLALELG